MEIWLCFKMGTPINMSYNVIYIYMYIRTYKIMFSYILVGGIPTPLKNMSSSVGIIPT